MTTRVGRSFALVKKLIRDKNGVYKNVWVKYDKASHARIKSLNKRLNKFKKRLEYEQRFDPGNTQRHRYTMERIKDVESKIKVAEDRRRRDEVTISV